jgi:hypothetical protein
MNEMPLPLAKSMPDQFCEHEVSAQTGIAIIFWEKLTNERKTASSRILVAKKIRYWWVVAHSRLIDPSCPTWRARKNYARLCAKYPEIMTKLGLNEFSAS